MNLPPPEFWIRLPLASLLIFGIWTLFEKGMLLGWLGDKLWSLWPEPISKPIFACGPCMSSTWGSLFWFVTGGTTEHWLIFIIALCGLNRLLSSNLHK